jgi:hypothetical protein
MLLVAGRQGGAPRRGLRADGGSLPRCSRLRCRCVAQGGAVARHATLLRLARVLPGCTRDWLSQRQQHMRLQRPRRGLGHREAHQRCCLGGARLSAAAGTASGVPAVRLATAHGWLLLQARAAAAPDPSKPAGLKQAQLCLCMQAWRQMCVHTRVQRQAQHFSLHAPAQLRALTASCRPHEPHNGCGRLMANTRQLLPGLRWLQQPHSAHKRRVTPWC